MIKANLPHWAEFEILWNGVLQFGQLWQLYYQRETYYSICLLLRVSGSVVSVLLDVGATLACF